MAGVLVEFVGVGEFHDLAEVHDGDAAADLADGPQIVGDEEQGHAGLVLDLPEQVQNLGADGDVQGGHGFVGDDEFGAQGQGAGDADALALAAGELVGVA